MIERMKQLLRENDSCVLATCSENRPHCSLMAYVANDAGSLVYMLTQVGSRKFENMLQNPHVSFLVDTRNTGTIQERNQVEALTAHGFFSPIRSKPEKDLILRRLVERHPHLRKLADLPDAEVFSIEIESFLLLDGVLDSHYEKVG